MISTTSAVLFGRKGLGASNVDELIALSKTKKDGLSFAHPGPGTFQYLTALAIMKQAGIEPRYVAYRAAPQMAQDVLSGHVDITILSLPAAAGFLENGSAISLGVLRGERDAMVPNLPTINESQSFKNIDAPLWLGLFAPKGVPDAALKRLTQAVKEMNADPDLPAQRRKTGEQIAKIDTAEAFAAFTEEEDRKLTQLVKIANSAQGGDEKK